jgi:uncharacterized membrane protein
MNGTVSAVNSDSSQSGPKLVNLAPSQSDFWSTRPHFYYKLFGTTFYSWTFSTQEIMWIIIIARLIISRSTLAVVIKTS